MFESIKQVGRAIGRAILSGLAYALQQTTQSPARYIHICSIVLVVMATFAVASVYAPLHFKSITLVLIKLTAVFVLLAAVVGWLIHKDSIVWKYVDPVYYLFGIIGLILLFINSERDRTLAELRLERDQMATEKTQHDRAPDSSVGEVGSSFLQVAYGRVWEAEKLGVACSGGNDAGGQCIEAERYQGPISEAFKNFSVPADTASQNDRVIALLDFCKRSEKLLDTLSADDYVFRELGESIAKIRAMGLQPMQWGESDREEALFLAKLDRDRDAQLAVELENKRQFITATWAEKSYVASSLHLALSICARIPKDAKQRIAETLSWQKTESELSQKQRQLDDQLQQLANEKLRDPALGTWYDFLWRNFWPFILVAALALKLAKSIAPLRS